MARRARIRQSHTHDPVPSFEEDYLDIDHWPYRWGINAHALPAAQRVLDIFKAFLFDLLERGFARKTLLAHRDHLSSLGEEVARRLNATPQLRRRVMTPPLLAFLDEKGGPVLHPPASSAAQRSFDSTCIKLRQFLLDRG